MGDNTHPVLTGEEIDQLIREGRTETWIGREYGITQQAVHYARFNAGGRPRTNVYKTTRDRAKDFFPWKKVGAAVTESVPWRMLKAHSVWQARHREEDLTPKELRRLVSFYRRLLTEGLIVEFDPTIPPGEWDYPGFALRDRVESDRDLLIRTNDRTDLSSVPMRVHWSFPTVMPEGHESLLDLVDPLNPED